MGNDTSFWDRFTTARISRRRALQGAAIGGASVGAIAIVGCSSSSSNDKTPAASGTAATAGASAPLLGGTLRSVLSDPQSKFDAQKFPTFTVQGINSFSYSRLLKSDSGPDDPSTPDIDLPAADWYRPVPDLASKYESPDATTFIFTLQDGAKWHNLDPLNGRAVTADDVVNAWQYYQSARPDKGTNLSSVDSVTAVGTNQVQIKLKQAFGPFLVVISSPSDLWIYPPELTSNPDKLNSTMVGTGPVRHDQLHAGRRRSSSTRTRTGGSRTTRAMQCPTSITWTSL